MSKKLGENIKTNVEKNSTNNNDKVTTYSLKNFKSETITSEQEKEVLYRKNWNETNRLLNRYNKILNYYNSSVESIEIKEKNGTVTYLSMLLNENEKYNSRICINISNRNENNIKGYTFIISELGDISVKGIHGEEEIATDSFPATKFPDILKKVEDNLLQFEKSYKERIRKEEKEKADKIIGSIDY